MRVLIACEYSGTVRDAFIRAGHEAMSCDILPSESDYGPHYQGDVLDILNDGWDMMIAHPPCTYLSNSGVRWLHTQEGRWQKMIAGALFFKQLLEAPIPLICVENPVMHKYAVDIIGRRQDQTVQPYQYGHLECKRTCLWIKGLPLLTGTEDVKAETMALPYAERCKVHSAGPSDTRQKDRSLFFRGIADAMADQWGDL